MNQRKIDPRKALFTLFGTVLLCGALPASAQPLPDWAAPSGPPEAQSAPPPPPPAPAQVPIDGGLGLLALAGAGFAAKKLRNRRRAAREAEGFGV